MSHTRQAESRKPLIPVVDDDRMMRELVRDALEAGGFDVVDAKNGEEAVARFRELRPSLLILDLQMPVMDGLESCREIRREFPEDPTPIVMLTGTEDR